ncbi:MAG: 5-formyltetrahydrofolate cyclo-ligase [Proteobacteria bacterium]|nr:5-formyltetrahydrofolate cyclo-ligase [Pseudomonadota bacterium]
MSASQKKILRLMMKERRALLFQQNPEAGEHLANFYFDNFALDSRKIIGGYWPIGSEVDIKPLLYKLNEKGFQCALPCITTEGLIFRLWAPSTSLMNGEFGILEPPVTAPVVFPDVLFVPLLAFDKEGHRLGYGQGHYDRYLHHHKALAIGIGFKGQEIDEIPRQSHDFALDYILTEEGITKFK